MNFPMTGEKMPRKNYSWAKVKATKTPDEWRKINKAYAQRFRLRNQLKIKGAELLNKIHNYRLIQSPGPADTLIDEVRKALRLPYAWNQEDYDHAEARLKDIEQNIAKIQQRITPKSSELANALMMVVLQSKESDKVKADALISVVEYIANQLSMEKIEGLENSKTNYVMTLLRTKDSYYPKWLPKFLYNNILQLLNEEDIEKLIKWLMKIVVASKNRNSIAKMMAVEHEDDMVIG